MRLSSEVMTCGSDRWEETMQHMILVTNNGNEILMGLKNKID